MLPYLPDVTEIDAGSCSDLDVLNTIHAHYPAIDLHYQLTACGKTFDRFSRELTFCAEPWVTRTCRKWPSSADAL